MLEHNDSALPVYNCLLNLHSSDTTSLSQSVMIVMKDCVTGSAGSAPSERRLNNHDHLTCHWVHLQLSLIRKSHKNYSLLIGIFVGKGLDCEIARSEKLNHC